MYAGTFKPTADGYSGRIRMFGINEAIIVVPAEPNDAENAPDYRVHLDEEAGPEIGAGWKRVGEKAGDHSSIELDSAIFAGPPSIGRAACRERVCQYVEISLVGDP